MKLRSTSPNEPVFEIRDLLRHSGATGFSYAETGKPPRILIEFEMHNYRVRLVVDLPNHHQFRVDERGCPRAVPAIIKLHEQAMRHTWSQLATSLKAKLCAVEEGVFSFEQEFGMHFVTYEGVTIYEKMRPHFPQTTAERLPPMLPAHVN